MGVNGVTCVHVALCRDPSTRHLDGQKRIWTGRNMVDGLWMGKKMKEQKKVSKTVDIVSYALKVSVNGVIYVFVAHFRSSGTI